MKRRIKNQWNKEKVKALRQHLKLTQARLAEELGTRQQTISDWEKGLHTPRGAATRLLDIVAERSGFQYKAEKEENE